MRCLEDLGTYGGTDRTVGTPFSSLFSTSVLSLISDPLFHCLVSPLSASSFFLNRLLILFFCRPFSISFSSWGPSSVYFILLLILFFLLSFVILCHSHSQSYSSSFFDILSQSHPLFSPILCHPFSSPFSVCGPSSVSVILLSRSLTYSSSFFDILSQSHPLFSPILCHPFSSPFSVCGPSSISVILLSQFQNVFFV